MSEDLIDDIFSSLDEHYPGSKRKRKPAPEPKTKPVFSWDEKPYVKTLPNGTDMEFFTIGAIAKALDRPIITIRTWIKLGYLPQSPYRLPPKPDKNGNERLGRRLYSRGMIQVVIEVFQKNGIFQEERIEWLEKHKQVSLDIASEWDKLRLQEMQTTT